MEISPSQLDRIKDYVCKEFRCGVDSIAAHYFHFGGLPEKSVGLMLVLR